MKNFGGQVDEPIKEENKIDSDKHQIKDNGQLKLSLHNMHS